jgi:uncharacterized membrane protein
MIRKTRIAIATTVMAALPLAVAATPAHAVNHHRVFANCTAMHKVYPHGVGKRGARDKVSGHTKPVTNFKRDTALYKANKKSDRDKDGVACEQR